MAKLPYNRVVDVNVSRNDRFPSRRGFGTQLILTGTSVNGIVDGNNRTKLYSSIDEIKADYPSNTEVYAAANTAFAQNPRPPRVKVGYIDNASATDANGLKAELDAIYDIDQAFYMITLEAAMRDAARLDGLVEWTEAKSKINMIDSNDAGHKTATNATNISARHKGTVERTSVFYHDDASEYLASAMASYMSTRNFDQADSAYTLKFKEAKLVNNINVGTAAVTAITGFTEALGQSESVGHCANCYIDIGDKNFLVEGSTLTQNVFVDEIHATDWIVARTEEEALGLFLNNARIPYTDQGMQQLASVPRAIMAQGVRAGIVANDLNPETGEYEPAVRITVPSVFDVPESQRKARISPVIAVTFRYAGAVHYTTINYTMTF